MLVLAPAASMLSAIGISETLKCCFRSLQAADEAEELNIGNGERSRAHSAEKEGETIEKESARGGGVVKKAKKSVRVRKSKATKAEAAQEAVKAADKQARAQPEREKVIPRSVALMMIIGSFSLLYQYVKHAVWATSEAYSSPSIVLSGRGSSGERIFFDDYREAYYWLRQNTGEDDKVMSWWDYGRVVQNCAQIGRGLRAGGVWRNDRIQRGRHQQVLMDGEDRGLGGQDGAGEGLSVGVRGVHGGRQRGAGAAQVADVQAVLLPVRGRGRRVGIRPNAEDAGGGRVVDPAQVL
ncbi:oligosaccharyl transferase STT3 family GT66 [Gracilaria domingensis]|nr:oligosaccharyl transferase STT3 family GT66 [Gracilaria domingensis]